MIPIQKDLDGEIFKREKEKENYIFSTCIHILGKIFSFTTFNRIPIMVDPNTGEINIIDDLINYDSSFAADHMIGFEKDIFVLELNGKRLMKFNIDDRKCTYFNIECNKKNFDNYAAFAEYGRNLYIFPIFADRIIKIDLDTRKTKNFGELYSKIHSQYKGLESKENFTYFICGCQMKNIMWLFQKKGNVVIAYNMEDDTWKEYRISKKICNCIHAIYTNQMIYILDSTGKVYCWNMIDESVELFADCSNGKNNVNTFSRIIVTEKKTLVLPLFGKDIFCIDMYTKQMEKYDEYPMEFKYFEPEGWSKFYGFCEDYEHYYFAMRSTEFMLSLNKEEGKLKWIRIKLPLYREYLKIYMKYNRYVVNEMKYGSNDLQTFLNIENIDNNKNVNLLTGNQIWKEIKMI